MYCSDCIDNKEDINLVDNSEYTEENMYDLDPDDFMELYGHRFN